MTLVVASASAGFFSHAAYEASIRKGGKSSEVQVDKDGTKIK